MMQATKPAVLPSCRLAVLPSCRLAVHKLVLSKREDVTVVYRVVKLSFWELTPFSCIPMSNRADLTAANLADCQLGDHVRLRQRNRVARYASRTLTNSARPSAYSRFIERSVGLFPVGVRP